MSFRKALGGPSFLVAALLNAQVAPEVLVGTRTFLHPEQGPYVEVSVAALGASLVHAPNASGREQTRLEVTTIVEQNGAIIDFRKTEVLGPERTSDELMDLSHSETFALDPGSYALEVSVKDLNNSEGAVHTSKEPLAVGDHGDAPYFSDVLLCAELAVAEQDGPNKGGYRITPFIGTYYPQGLNKLQFYAELYHVDHAVGMDSLYLLVYQIEGLESKKIHGPFRAAARVKARPVEPFKGSFDITDLPSGNYVLALEAIDRKGSVICRKEQLLQRNNPISYDFNDLSTVSMGSTFADRIQDPDTLAEYLRSMRPISQDMERKIIDDRIRDQDMELMRRFMYSFWFNRDGYDPEAAWKDYHKEVLRVQGLYGTRNKKGYETDRGVVHLKYGMPNSIVDRGNEMDAYPYQIWHYYRAGRYTNRRFVFYQPDLITNDYELLHSEVPGEMQNPRWNELIHSRNHAIKGVNPLPVESMSGERAIEFFNDPR
ncbi:MAG: GWxTD domain-containing protein [Flavobacteriales bacterium]|nr:GWxTD domain-containing protein [Flavobacteriales bacterium]